MRVVITLSLMVAGASGCGQSASEPNAAAAAPQKAEVSDPSQPDSADGPRLQAGTTPSQVDLNAPPSDARILADVGGNKDGVVSIKLQDKRGKKRWSSIHSQYFWERFVIVKRQARLADFPDAGLLVGGYARYEITNGRYHYREFKVAWNEYEGIPRPTAKQATDFIKANMSRFVGGVGNVLVKPEEIKLSIASADEQEWIWHTPNSVSFNVRMQYTKVISNTELAEVDSLWQVRFYRGNVKDPWQSLMGTEKRSTETDRVLLTEKGVNALPRGIR